MKSECHVVRRSCHDPEAEKVEYKEGGRPFSNCISNLKLSDHRSISRSGFVGVCLPHHCRSHPVYRFSIRVGMSENDVRTIVSNPDDADFVMEWNTKPPIAITSLLAKYPQTSGPLLQIYRDLTLGTLVGWT